MKSAPGFRRVGVPFHKSGRRLSLLLLGHSEI
jgi:hypothetical protein